MRINELAETWFVIKGYSAWSVLLTLRYSGFSEDSVCVRDCG